MQRYDWDRRKPKPVKRHDYAWIVEFVCGVLILAIASGAAYFMYRCVAEAAR